MTSKLTIAKPGGGVTDLTGFSPSLRKGAAYFDHNDPLIQLGMRCSMGEASQGTFKLMDPDAQIPALDYSYGIQAHKLITWSEDASGDEIWLARGRTSTYDGGRGKVLVDDEVEYDVTVDDGNVDLRGQAFTTAWERPEETDVARVLALQAYTLNGSSSTATHHRDSCEITAATDHLCPNANTVTMPAKTYPVGTQPQDVLQDCADTASKLYSVVIHHDGGSHLCLFYTSEADHTTFPSAVRISDHVDEWDPDDLTAPVFEPHWEQGKASLYDGQQLLSGLVSIYAADSAVFVEHSANIDTYDYWVDSYSDSVSVNPTQATLKASGVLEYRRLTHVTHRVSVMMLPEQMHLLGAGMSIEVKAAAMMGGQYLDTWQTRRIAECSFEPIADGRYWAHLSLDRSQKRMGYTKGPVTVPKPPGGTCTDLTATLAPPGFNGDSTAHWVEGGADTNPVNHLGRQYLQWHGLSNPWAFYNFSGTWNAGTTYTIGFWTKVTAAPATFTVGAGNGSAPPVFTADFESITVASAESDWTYHEIEWTPTSTYNSGTGTYPSVGVKFDIHYASSSTDYVFIDDGTVQACTDAESPITIGGPGEGTVGSGTPVSVPTGTIVEHGDLSGKGGTMHDAEQVEVAPFGTIAATNVQDALEEIVAEAGGAPTNADYLVGTANGSLSNEIVVGTTPGGELGGTWASPTVDATHSGSTHDAATNTHIADATDAHDASAISIVDAGGYFTGTEVEAALQELGAGGGGGGGLTIEEVDGTPTIAATKLVFPNGTLTDHGGGEAEYTPTGGGGFLGHQYLGTSSIGATQVNVTQDAAHTKVITVPTGGGLLTNIEIYVKNEVAANALSWAALLYDDDGSGTKPLHIIASIQTETARPLQLYRVAATAGDARWLSLPIGKFLLAGTYHIGFEIKGNAANYYLHYDAGSDWTWTKGGNTFYTDAPGTSGTVYTLTDSTRDYSLRAGLLT